MLLAAGAHALGRRVLSRGVAELRRALERSEPTAISTANRRRWNTRQLAEPYSTPERPALGCLNKLCAIEDWKNPAMIAAMRRQLPYYVQGHPEFPRGLEHRKHWEYAHAVVGLEQLGSLGS